jgi:cytochrome P450
MQELRAEGLAATQERPQPRAFAFSDLGRLSYLNAVIKEALRFMPPVALIPPAREVVAESVTVCGHVLPRGTVVLTPPASLGRHRGTYGEDADVFRPERWLAPGKGKPTGAQLEAAGADALACTQACNSDVPAMAAPESALPEMAFSWGPRDCVGQALARVELQVVLAVLLGRLRFELYPSVGGFEGLLRERMVLRTTMQFDGGLPMLVHPWVTHAAP